MAEIGGKRGEKKRNGEFMNKSGWKVTLELLEFGGNGGKLDKG